jgi:hypothetical protein
MKKFILKNKDKLDFEEMPNGNQSRFEKKILEELHQNSQSKNLKKMWFAAASAIFFVGFILFLWVNKNEDEVFANKLLIGMKSQFPHERIDALYDYQEVFKKEDDRLVNALFKILRQDSNNNVKVASIEALLKFPNNDEMRLNLIEALNNEKAPIVQLKLIDALMQLNEARAENTLKNIIKREEVFPKVKTNASIVLTKLNS